MQLPIQFTLAANSCLPDVAVTHRVGARRERLLVGLLSLGAAVLLGYLAVELLAVVPCPPVQVLPSPSSGLLR